VAAGAARLRLSPGRASAHLPAATSHRLCRIGNLLTAIWRRAGTR
jgi:hypothetical protein